MMETIFLTWRSQKNQKWYPIGLLNNGDMFRFRYTQGVLEANKECGFRPFECFPSFTDTYYSKNLFPLFENRLPSKNRNDYETYLEYLNLDGNMDDPITILGRSGGQRQTDYCELFTPPQPDNDGKFHSHFFARGLSHFAESTVERINQLREKESLELMHDFQNDYDPNAFLIRTEDQINLGFVPRYLGRDLINIKNFQEEISLSVERVNKEPAPTQFRLLCSLTANWPAGYKLFAGDEFMPVNDSSQD